MSPATPIKRIFDLLASAFCFIIFAPVFVLVAIIIRLDSPGPILFRQTRIGAGGKSFTMLKFRTMYNNSENQLENLLDNHPDKRLSWDQFQKITRDPRLTRVGRQLRRYSLDELPQLWNVLKGDMSLVGPRPCLPSQKQFYGDLLDVYISVRPGVTGLWQVSGRNLLSFEERVKLDVSYIDNWSLGLDVIILLRTFRVVIRHEGAF